MGQILTNKYRRLPLDQIVVHREQRQRRELRVEELMPSIQRFGVMNPIIVKDGTFELIAGERRLAASQRLQLPDIPVRFASELSDIEFQIIELEENVARTDLPWNDRCQAVVRIHSLYVGLKPDWTQQQTADALGMTKGTISLYLQVGKAVLEGNEKIQKATTVRQAHNTLNRDQARKEANLLGEIVEANVGEDKKQELDADSVLCLDFIEWAAQYSGPKFNFLHCDFPYGVNMQSSEQGNTDQYGAYEDTPEVYWTLLEALSQLQDNFLHSSSHMMFWFSMKFYRETLAFFTQKMPDWEFDLFPLIWTKSDNRGILPDPKRGPRRIYETCLFASRGDRLIVRSVSNSYSAPTGEKSHQSEKPEPVLRHFMQMFVDEHSRMLDPTCGSGSSLRAAESLGAPFVLGIEKNPDFASGARLALKNFRTLRKLSK